MATFEEEVEDASCDDDDELIYDLTIDFTLINLDSLLAVACRVATD
ncbi:16056_t:CDS:2 [Rhizophagus irregularis]|nr:16056_t:CDS:2 [Rhizophagus irregularis]